MAETKEDEIGDFLGGIFKPDRPSKSDKTPHWDTHEGVEFATYKMSDGWHWEVAAANMDAESEYGTSSRRTAEKAARRYIDRKGKDIEMYENPPADNTMIWVLGIGAAVTLAWLWKGGAARNKTGRLTYGMPGHGAKPATPMPRQYNPPGYYQTQGNAVDRFGGPWPINHTRGAGL